MHRSEYLKKVDQIINGPRVDEYGDPKESFERIAYSWTRYLGDEISVADVAIMMILFKLARLEHNATHEDSWIDIMGYAAIAAELLSEEPKNAL